MPISLNTSDPLASSLTYLIGVDDDNQIKFFKGGLTPTAGANVSIQSGSFGRAFRTGSARSADSLVSWPVQQASNVTPITVFVAYNQFNSASVISTGISALMFSGRLDGTAGSLLTGLQMDIGNGQWMPSLSTTGVAQSAQDASNTDASAITAAGAHSIAWRTNGIQAASVSAFRDGILDTFFNPARTNAGALYGGGSATANFQGIGGNVVGATAQSALSLDYVYVAIWIGTTVSDADIARLHASLTGSNAFALVNTGATPTGPTINTQPGSSSVTAPATATFTVAATASAGSLTYQWQRSTNSGGSWANVTTGTGGTTSSYTTAATTVSGGNANNGDQYRCAVTDSNGTTNTSAATLTVAAATLAITTDVLEDETNAVLSGLTVAKVAALRLSDLALVCTWANQTTDGAGRLTLSNVALTAVPHLIVTSSSDGADAGAKVYTPA